MSEQALLIILGIISAITWMVVGWRAMRAHEHIADTAEPSARRARETAP